MNYTTKSGDMFDMIAYEKLGDCLHTQELMRENRRVLNYFIFNSGVEINIPTVESSAKINLPPWKR